jgi:glycosyltransferase involved in cell wall biosynthesis
MSPLRIALVAACPFPSLQGSQVFVGQMATRLAGAGHAVHLLTYGQGAEQAGRGYRHHRIARFPGDDSQRSGPNAAKPLLDAMLAARLVRLVREEAIDVVHAHNYEAAAAALVARARTGVPVVYHSHNLMGDELATYFARPVARRLAAVAGALADAQIPRRADAVIALCDWSAARLRAAGCDAVRLHVIPPAVEDEGALDPNPAARAAFGLDPADFVVGYCGNLDAYQNLPLLFEGFARFAAGSGERRLPSRPRLLIATHSPSGELRELARAHGLGDALVVVDAAGHSEARMAVAASDILGLPRRLGSGYPVKLLNYMSSARAVVTAGCGSKVLRDGLDGVVVPDDDPAALSDALERCRADRAWCEALGKQARQSFLARLTWQAVLPQIEDVYAGLREQGGHRGS